MGAFAEAQARVPRLLAADRRFGPAVAWQQALFDRITTAVGACLGAQAGVALVSQGKGLDDEAAAALAMGAAD